MSESYGNWQSPRMRIETKGVQALSDGELLAALINSGTRNNSALSIGHNILRRFDLRRLSVASVKELSDIPGIKGVKAAQIAACFEISRRLENYKPEPKYKISGPEDVYRRLYPYMRENKRESFIELCLDTKNQVIRETTISIGSLNANVVHPREVFREALANSAASIIVAHNHPSGDPTPSREDIEITKKLSETGNIMGITVLDHVIIGDGRHFSMKEAGHL